MQHFPKMYPGSREAASQPEALRTLELTLPTASDVVAPPLIQSQDSCLTPIPTASERPPTTLTVSPLVTFSRPAGDELGEALSDTPTLEEHLRKVRGELYHLRWSAKDVAERAVQEALKQAKLPGFTGQVRARCRRLYSEVSLLPPACFLLQFPVLASQKAGAAGTSAVRGHTFFSRCSTLPYGERESRGGKQSCLSHTFLSAQILGPPQGRTRKKAWSQQSILTPVPSHAQKASLSLLPGTGHLHRKSPFPQLQHSEQRSEQPLHSDTGQSEQSKPGRFPGNSGVPSI